jgi:hypothetical protein
VENFGDIKKADYVAFFIANGLEYFISIGAVENARG